MTTPERSTSPKPFIFVLMPFSPEFKDVYQLGIKAASEEAGAYCEKVDEQMYEGTILNRIYHQISTADIIIADMTGRNPNVFYEVGYAHALDKRVILLTQKEDDIPFDLKHYPHIVYKGSITDLKNELLKRIKWAISNPKQSSLYFDSPIQCFVNDVPLRDNPEIPLPIKPMSLSRFSFLVNFHNSTDKSIEYTQFKVGIICQPEISYLDLEEYLHKGDYINAKYFRQPNGSILFLIQPDYDLLPKAWDKLCVSCSSGAGEKFKVNQILTFKIRIFTEAGAIDYPFQIKLVKEE